MKMFTLTLLFLALFVQPAETASSKAIAEESNRQSLLDTSKLSDPLPQNLFIELSKLINPTVVSITTATNVRPRARGQHIDPFQQLMEQFMGGGSRPRPQQGLGTGFIIRADGLIITNNHVIEQADVIKVSLEAHSEKLYEAEVIGRDKRTDIALIKIDAKKPLPVAQLGTSKDLQVGEWVAAFGNPYGHAHTMTKGIISAIGRQIDEINSFPFLQTDASINPGNSGGPLVNTKGYVIGVNSAIDPRAQGIGFAIPIDNVKTIVKQLEETGQVKRGFIGVGIGLLNPEWALRLGLESPNGVVITHVARGSAAEQAGVQERDVITEFGGKKIATPEDLINAVADIPVGQKAKAKIIRLDDKLRKTEKTLEIKVADNPEDGRKKPATKKFIGQKAPFELGFRVSELTAQLAEEFEIENDAPRGPIVIEVERGSPAAAAGLLEGDIILGINRQPVSKPVDVLRLLQEGKNILRVARGDMVASIYIETRRK